MTQHYGAWRIISSYYTVSMSAALVLAGMPPIDLFVEKRMKDKSYNKCKDDLERSRGPGVDRKTGKEKC